MLAVLVGDGGGPILNDKPQPLPSDQTAGVALPTSKCVDWYHEGECRSVEIGGVRIVIRFVGRRGRRGRIAIEAPAGAVFQALDRGGVTDCST
jgi:hypothetical protein